jgi:thiol-disulfide isomerase/thioredoxin
MTFKLRVSITVLCFLFSCGLEDNSNSIVLKIILTKEKAELLINKYVYLVNISKRSVVDSVLVKGDTVVFSELWTPSFIPYMVSIERNDTFQGHPHPRPIGLQSPYNAKFIYSSFYLDKGVTILKPYLTGCKNEQTDFIGSKQNEPFLKGVELQYAKENSVDRHAIITKNISKIKAYPYSIHLLEQLFRCKEKFLNEDLKNQLSFFNDDMKKTPLFKGFSEYFATSSTYDRAFPLIELESQNGNYQKIESDSATYYLIVFWASWCGPCRKEIPDLKELYNKFTNRGLTITSISIDGDKRNWQTALQHEKCLGSN